MHSFAKVFVWGLSLELLNKTDMFGLQQLALRLSSNCAVLGSVRSYVHLLHETWSLGYCAI